MIEVINTSIKDVKIIKPLIHNDGRGYFFESFNQIEFHKKIGKMLSRHHYQRIGVCQFKTLTHLIEGSIKSSELPSICHISSPSKTRGMATESSKNKRHSNKCLAEQ